MRDFKVLNEKGKPVSEDTSVQRLSTIQIELLKNKLFLLSDFHNQNEKLSQTSWIC
jgi:hypothetical protein